MYDSVNFPWFCVSAAKSCAFFTTGLIDFHSDLVSGAPNLRLMCPQGVPICKSRMYLRDLAHLELAP